MAAAAQPTRYPAARSSGDAETAAGVRRMLEAMRLPCAIYAEHDDRTLCCNRAFRNEFAPQSAEQDRAAFLASFERFTGCPRSAEAASDPAELPREEVFAPDTGRSYAFIWSRTEFAGADARLLCALNLTDVQESMRRHGALQEQLLITSRAMSVAEIVSTLAHELNQPLAAIINFIDAGSATQAGETDERAAEAHAAAERAAAAAQAEAAAAEERARVCSACARRSSSFTRSSARRRASFSAASCTCDTREERAAVCEVWDGRRKNGEEGRRCHPHLFLE